MIVRLQACKSCLSRGEFPPANQLRNSRCLSFGARLSVKVLACFLGLSHGTNVQASSDPSPGKPSQASYQNQQLNEGPWSIHVARIPRIGGRYDILAVHAHGAAVGLSTVTDQTKIVSPARGVPIAAINGDFYQREGVFSGDPRGLQIAEGELISAPDGGASFWVDAIGELHAGTVHSKLQVTWPDGTSSDIGLNGARLQGRAELYTSAMGASTRARRGRELVLSHVEQVPWLPLHAGKQYRLKVTGIHEQGDTRIVPGTVVLSLDPSVSRRVPRIETGSEIVLSTATEPRLRGVRSAISGGPVLLRDGKRQAFKPSETESHVLSSMQTRHPRSAVGWNEEFLFLVQVDGRYPGFSEGMTLAELARHMARLGCREAINLDGGGSSAIWYDGAIRNRPCDGRERRVANSLVVVEKRPPKLEPARSKSESPAP